MNVRLNDKMVKPDVEFSVGLLVQSGISTEEESFNHSPECRVRS